MQRAWAGVLAGLMTLAFASPPASAAGMSVRPTAHTEPGVTIDEGSPAAKEYALALTQARHTGSTGSTGTRAGSSEVPFGAGIRPPAGPGSGANGGSPASTRHGRLRGATPATDAPAGGEAGHSAPPLPTAVLRAGRVTASGDSSLLALLGGGVAILVLGALGGVVLRRNRRPPSHA